MCEAAQTRSLKLKFHAKVSAQIVPLLRVQRNGLTFPKQAKWVTVPLKTGNKVKCYEENLEQKERLCEKKRDETRQPIIRRK